MDSIAKEHHRRKMIAIWVWYELRKKSVVTLTELEEHFKRHCEHIMHEFCVRGIFASTGTIDDIGWYMHKDTQNDNLSEFHERLNKLYKE